MAATLLLPGMGGRNTQTITIAANDTEVFSETQDASRCGAFSVQLKSYTGDGTVQLRAVQKIDDTNWAEIDMPAVVAVGGILRFTSQLGPFGIIKIGAISSAATGLPDDVVVVTLGERAPAGF